ncbi:transposable element Tcb2 transposase [Trichonephila clavipes]|nr:transposable element Tcb2 transposase [Trichonephila clavipes]
MPRTGGQPKVKPPVFSSQASLVLIYRSTEGMKGWVDLAHTEDSTSNLWCGSMKRYHSLTYIVGSRSSLKAGKNPLVLESFLYAFFCFSRVSEGDLEQNTEYGTLLKLRNLTKEKLALSGRSAPNADIGGGLYARRPVVCVPLTKQHRTARLQWCREHHNWTEQDWACVLFSDESRFSLSSDCRRQLIWRESGTAYRPENIQEKDRYPTCSIMVWAGVMINGRTHLHVVANGTMTGQRYIDEVLLPHVRLFRGAVDLNPTENVWDAWGRQVVGRNCPPTNKNTLIRALTEEWDKLPQQLLDNVVQSMRRYENYEMIEYWVLNKESLRSTFNGIVLNFDERRYDLARLHTNFVAAVDEWYRYRIVVCLVTSSPAPLKTRRVGQRCTLNLSRAETSSRWCGMVVRRGGCQLRCRPRHFTKVQNYMIRHQKPSCS